LEIGNVSYLKKSLSWDSSGMFGDSFGIILEDCGIFKDSLGILQDFKKKEKRRKDTFSISGVFRDSLGLILRFFEILWNSRASLFQCLLV